MQSLIEALTRNTETFGMFVGCSTIGLIVITVVGIIQWRKHRQAEMEATLKQQMIERGMSADEIVQVLAAGQSKASRPNQVPLKQTADYKG